MSKQGGPFPTEDADFNEYLERAVPYLLTNWNRLVSPPIPPAGAVGAAAAPVDPRRALLETKYNAWNGLPGVAGIFPQSQNPDVRTKTITGQKDSLRKEIEALLRDIFKNIPDAWLNPHDREVLNLPVPKDKHSHHITPIEGVPVFGMEAMGGGDVKFMLRPFSDTKRSSKPEGTDIEIRYKIQSLDAEEIPQVVNDLPNQVVCTKAIFILHCGTDVIEKVLYAAVRWVDLSNPSLNGPWSNIQHTGIV